MHRRPEKVSGVVPVPVMMLPGMSVGDLSADRVVVPNGERDQRTDSIARQRSVQRPTYDEEVVRQLDEVTTKYGQGDVAKLFNSGDTWEVK